MSTQIHNVRVLRTTSVMALRCIQGITEFYVPVLAVDDESDVFEAGQEGTLLVADWWAAKHPELTGEQVTKRAPSGRPMIDIVKKRRPQPERTFVVKGRKGKKKQLQLYAWVAGGPPDTRAAGDAATWLRWAGQWYTMKQTIIFIDGMRWRDIEQLVTLYAPKES